MLDIIYRFLISLLFLFFLTGSAMAGEEQLKIAVASEGEEIASEISKVAARAPYFLFFDKQNNLLETIKNPYNNASGGAGPKAADFLAEKNVTLVIAGQFGRKMLKTLHSHEIKNVEFQGRAIDAVKEQNHAQ